MVDRYFADPALAELYDTFCPREERQDFDFYLPHLLEADAVLDVGCGTGSLLHEARDAGHRGRLVGLDPGPGMLLQARRRSDVEWVEGDVQGMAWSEAFDFVVMTGHAFQVLLDDEEIRAALDGIHRALRPGGRFGFETRNPAARPWERWSRDYARERMRADGHSVSIETWVQGGLRDGRLRFRHSFRAAGSEVPGESWTTLRFLEAEQVREFVEAAGFWIERLIGDWDGSAISADSPEIITLARKA